MRYCEIKSLLNLTHSLDPSWSDRSVTVQKLEIQLRVKIDSLYLTTPKHSGGEDKLAVQVQTPKHSGGEDKLAVQVQTPKHSGGADNPAVQVQ